MTTTIDAVSGHELLWTPSEQRVRASRMAAYLAWVNRERRLGLIDYDELWRWSVDDIEGFWRSIWTYFSVSASAPPAAVLGNKRMPGATWFPGARLNWAENVLRRGGWATQGPAVIGLSEDRRATTLSWPELTHQVAALAAHLRELGVRPGDRVAAYLPNIHQTVVALLATAAVGGIWSCCAPDLDTKGVLDRFRQIEPTVLIAVDGYRFAGREADRLTAIAELRAALPTLQHTIVVRDLRPDAPPPGATLAFDDLVAGDVKPCYEQLPFDHPLWILHGSATTGSPNGIVHSHGGILLEHLKVHALHFDSGPDDRVFIVASTASMVWNVLVSALAVGSTIICYDGSPVVPAPDALFRILSANRVTRFGTEAAYLIMCERIGMRPGERYDLTALRSIVSTGSPPPTSTWHWTYNAVKSDLLFGSDYGGTDVCTAFIGTNPMLPVRAGELQAPYLGARVEAWSQDGTPVVGGVGEMVVTAPMPSMPVSFWNDPDGTRHREEHFTRFPGVWRHGGRITRTHYGGYVVHGGSDATEPVVSRESRGAGPPRRSRL